jgi:hypothetical protein
MQSPILDGLGLVDATGRTILVATLASLLAAIACHGFLRARYAALERDARKSAETATDFVDPVLRRIAERAHGSAHRAREPNTQAIIEQGFQSGFKALLLAERFVRSATGLVIILGLLGTFYGLTVSIGRLVHLVGEDPGAGADVAQAVTGGLTQALTGMAVAFSNSLVGILSAVVLTVLGVFSNVTDRRTSLMLQLETQLDRLLSEASPAPPMGAADLRGFAASVARLEGVVGQFESALRRLSADTRGLREVQLVVALKPGDGR